MFHFTHPVPLSLYVHMPWCVQKCPYCDFNSHALRDSLPEEQYIQQLLNDLRQDAPLVRGRPLVSIFFGGGTPSLFSPRAISSFLLQVQELLPFSEGIEITLEANPGTLEHHDWQEYQFAGINRMSIGVQSFQDHLLKRLGRVHSSEEAYRAIQYIKQAGFRSLNLDLMYGLPDQTQAEAIADIERAMSLQLPHLSWYQLTLEPNTAFYIQPPRLPDDESIWAMQQEVLPRLNAAGYQQYEISAYAQTGKECQHNLNYWLYGDYLGVGAGAHSKITDLREQVVYRSYKTPHPKHYLRATERFAASHKQVQLSELPFEFMLNALRLYQDIYMPWFTERTGLPMSFIENRLAEAIQRGFLEYQDPYLRTTDLGKRFYNDLVQIFL
jgi:oxygen-independent coproporphyrinogen-3 oxidase